MAHAPQADDYLRPIFTSWSQTQAPIAQRLTLLRHTLGLTSRNHHVLHLPCRHSGATYRLPVALITDGEVAQIVATSAADSSNSMPLTWIVDARVARFVVLTRGNQQRIVEVQSASDYPNAVNRLIVLPERAGARFQARK